ncbi:hypothetical protein M427DRAFT_38275 [Gonapodya prolifera JEL478]|uniref:Uncharacterized protein n=1 Tax=Gonapodya prolifera (strain JEL478) TaxID=1344416 RepID=A0A138ZZD2_GONPJ|nr:hypothetical protein M427DRAFT_38275 [Gonapodya prolifera JEL478]|eukprot:KXS09850.1 hypothetical protein M427DRAFT_38275 [Gonapodya prolifera JEL478]
MSISLPAPASLHPDPPIGKQSPFLWTPTVTMRSRFDWSMETVTLRQKLDSSAARSHSTLSSGDLSFIAGIAHITNMKKRAPLCALTLVDTHGRCHRMDKVLALKMGQGCLFISDPSPDGLEVKVPRIDELVIGENSANRTTVAISAQSESHCGERRGVAFFVCGQPDRDASARLHCNDFFKQELEVVARALSRVKSRGIPIRSYWLTLLALLSFALGLATLIVALTLRIVYADQSGVDPIGAISTAVAVTLAALAGGSLLAGPQWSFQEVTRGIRWSQNLEEVVCGTDEAFKARLAMYVERMTGPRNLISAANTSWFRCGGVGSVEIQTPLRVIHLHAARCAIVAIRREEQGDWVESWPIFLDLRGQNALIYNMRSIGTVWYLGDCIRDLDWSTIFIFDGCLPAFLTMSIA